MKKTILSILALLLSLLLLALPFSACKKAPEEDKKAEEEQGEQTPDPDEGQEENVPDPDSLDAEGHQLAQPTISAARIAGDYTITGSFNWDDFTDDEKDETGEVSFTMNVFPGGENALSVTLIPTDETLPSTSFDVTDYDPLKGTCTLPDAKGVHGVVFPVSVTFSENGGKIAVSMQFDKTYEGEGRVFGSYEGQKK